MQKDTITLRGPHGIYQCAPTALDVMIARHLPASIGKLTEEITELNGEPLETPYTSVTEALMALAELSGYGMNPEIADGQCVTSTVVRRMTQIQEGHLDRLMQGAEWVVCYFPDEGFEHMDRNAYLSSPYLETPVAMFATEEAAQDYCAKASSPN